MDIISTEVDEKIQAQIEHIFNVHNRDMLRHKVNDLVYEWYVKGFNEGALVAKDAK